jgi:hypothetical protein
VPRSSHAARSATSADRAHAHLRLVASVLATSWRRVWLAAPLAVALFLGCRKSSTTPELGPRGRSLRPSSVSPTRRRLAPCCFSRRQRLASSPALPHPRLPQSRAQHSCSPSSRQGEIHPSAAAPWRPGCMCRYGQPRQGRAPSAAAPRPRGHKLYPDAEPSTTAALLYLGWSENKNSAVGWSASSGVGMVCTPAAPQLCSTHCVRRSDSSPCEVTYGGGDSLVVVVFDAAIAE